MLGLRPQSCVPSSSQEGPSSLGMGATTLRGRRTQCSQAWCFWPQHTILHWHSKPADHSRNGQTTEDQSTDGGLTLGN